MAARTRVATKRGRWSRAERARLKELFGVREEAAIARDLMRPVPGVRRMAEKLLAPKAQSGPWTAREVLELKRYLGCTTTRVIARVLGRRVEEVEGKLYELARVRKRAAWRREEIAEFKRIYGTRTDDDLARIFGRSAAQVRELAREHALCKDKAFLRRLNAEVATPMPRWTAAQLEWIRREYPERSNLELARMLGRSAKSIVSKAHRLGLKKTSERKRLMGMENADRRYRWHERSALAARASSR